MNYNILNWDKLNLKNPVHMNTVKYAMANYMRSPSTAFNPNKEFMKARRHAVSLQNMATVSDFPEYLTNLFAKFQTMPIYDMGYEAIFDIRPLSGTDGYDVYATEDNIQFVKILPGGTVKYYGQAGAKYRVYVDFYGGGAAIDHRLLYARDFYRIEELLTALRNRAYIKKASVAYGLIEAIGAGINVAWQNLDPSTLANTDATYTMNRDAQTMVTARNTLIANNLTKGYVPDGLTQTFVILCPYQLTQRIKRALAYRRQEMIDATTEVPGNFVVIETTMLASSTQYYMIIPKGKSTGATLLDLTQFNEFNQDNLTEKIADWMAFGFDIGDTQQFARLAIS